MHVVKFSMSRHTGWPLTGIALARLELRAPFTAQELRRQGLRIRARHLSDRSGSPGPAPAAGFC